MVHVQAWNAAVLSALGFCAGFVDSAVGGGGLVSLPALLLVGLPPAQALGTNKLGGTMGAVMSAWNYFRFGKMDRQLARGLMPVSLAASVLGAVLVHRLPAAFLKPLVLALLCAVTLYTLLRPNVGRQMTYRGASARTWAVMLPMAGAIGFYDGFFGPGTGSFLILAFLLLGFDFVQASGNAKALNLASNVGALLTFVSLDSVRYTFGVILGVAMVIGAWVGSQLAIRRGAAYLRPIYIAITCGMIGDQAWKLVRAYHGHP
ncbi:MAG: TSUP family transporter [Alicyclobacillus sp.]|nr:TSUP family transporter [Alicyclobacillus sp.]